MITVEYKTSDLREFYSKMDKILERIKKGAENGIKQATEDTRKKALELKRGEKSEELIQDEYKTKDNEYIGRVYTTFPYACFLEYGTGVLADGEMPHIGQTETFYKSGMQYWYLPVAKAKRKLNNKIVLLNVRDKNGNPTGNYIEAYMMFATQPYPFMRPTAFERRKLNVDAVKKAIIESIGGS